MSYSKLSSPLCHTFTRPGYALTSHFILVSESVILPEDDFLLFSSCPWSRFWLRGVTANCLHLRAGSQIRALALSGNVRNTACNTELSVSVNIYWQGHCRAGCVNGWIWNTGEMILQSSATVNLVQMPLCSPQIPLWFHSEAYESPVAKHLNHGMGNIRPYTGNAYIHAFDI